MRGPLRALILTSALAAYSLVPSPVIAQAQRQSEEQNEAGQELSDDLQKLIQESIQAVPSTNLTAPEPKWTPNPELQEEFRNIFNISNPATLRNTPGLSGQALNDAFNHASEKFLYKDKIHSFMTLFQAHPQKETYIPVTRFGEIQSGINYPSSSLFSTINFAQGRPIEIDVLERKVDTSMDTWSETLRFLIYGQESYDITISQEFTVEEKAALGTDLTRLDNILLSSKSLPHLDTGIYLFNNDVTINTGIVIGDPTLPDDLVSKISNVKKSVDLIRSDGLYLAVLDRVISDDLTRYKELVGIIYPDNEQEFIELEGDIPKPLAFIINADPEILDKKGIVLSQRAIIGSESTLDRIYKLCFVGDSRIAHEAVESLEDLSLNNVLNKTNPRLLDVMLSQIFERWVKVGEIGRINDSSVVHGNCFCLLHNYSDLDSIQLCNDNPFHNHYERNQAFSSETIGGFGNSPSNLMVTRMDCNNYRCDAANLNDGNRSWHSHFIRNLLHNQFNSGMFYSKQFPTDATMRNFQSKFRHNEDGKILEFTAALHMNISLYGSKSEATQLTSEAISQLAVGFEVSKWREYYSLKYISSILSDDKSKSLAQGFPILTREPDYLQQRLDNGQLYGMTDLRFPQEGFLWMQHKWDIAEIADKYDDSIVLETRLLRRFIETDAFTGDSLNQKLREAIDLGDDSSPSLFPSDTDVAINANLVTFLEGDKRLRLIAKEIEPFNGNLDETLGLTMDLNERRPWHKGNITGIVELYEVIFPDGERCIVPFQQQVPEELAPLLANDPWLLDRFGLTVADGGYMLLYDLISRYMVSNPLEKLNYDKFGHWLDKEFRTNTELSARATNPHIARLSINDLRPYLKHIWAVAEELKAKGQKIKSKQDEYYIGFNFGYGGGGWTGGGSFTRGGKGFTLGIGHNPSISIHGFGGKTLTIGIDDIETIVDGLSKPDYFPTPEQIQLAEQMQTQLRLQELREQGLNPMEVTGGFNPYRSFAIDLKRKQELIEELSRKRIEHLRNNLPDYLKVGGTGARRLQHRMERKIRNFAMKEISTDISEKHELWLESLEGISWSEEYRELSMVIDYLDSEINPQVSLDKRVGAALGLGALGLGLSEERYPKFGPINKTIKGLFYARDILQVLKPTEVRDMYGILVSKKFELGESFLLDSSFEGTFSAADIFSDKINNLEPYIDAGVNNWLEQNGLTDSRSWHAFAGPMGVTVSPEQIATQVVKGRLGTELSDGYEEALHTISLMPDPQARYAQLTELQISLQSYYEKNKSAFDTPEFRLIERAARDLTVKVYPPSRPYVAGYRAAVLLQDLIDHNSIDGFNRTLPVKVLEVQRLRMQALDNSLYDAQGNLRNR